MANGGRNLCAGASWCGCFASICVELQFLEFATAVLLFHDDSGRLKQVDSCRVAKKVEEVGGQERAEENGVTSMMHTDL